MSNYLVGIDQKSRPKWKQGRIRKAIGGVLFLALASVTIITGLQVKTVSAEINKSSVEDHLISPDMEQFIGKYGKYGKGRDYQEMDMQ